MGVNTAMPAISKRFLFGPRDDCPWASKMVLNPAMARDPDDPSHLHMLFRATGPGAEHRLPGRPDPYPICLGYAVSHDAGATWDVDWRTPAFAPALRQRHDESLYATDAFGRQWLNYANGCIEDPRLFPFEGELYLSVACRLFPPGPYWEHDDPLQCQPDWVAAEASMGFAARENATVSLLYRVDLGALARRAYGEAFVFVCPLHPPDASDDRDVVLFPRRLTLDGVPRIVCVHRPKTPWRYPLGEGLAAPAMFWAAADSLADLAGDPGRPDTRADGPVRRALLTPPVHAWEANRVGASWAPVDLGGGEWALPYHGKQDDTEGYTQSFLLLREQDAGLPVLAAHPAERLLTADQPWERTGDFTIPCVFSCSGVTLEDGRLLMGYGAADRVVGLAEVDAAALWSWLRKRETPAWR
jgi:hypothetical protein